jgi:dolichol-phosphate mannosyltransferase
MNIIGVKTRTNGTDFRIFTAEVAKTFLTLREHNRMTRGLIDSIGYESKTIEFVAPERYSGNSVYSFKQLIELSVNNMLANTIKPLVLSLIFGATIFYLSFTLLLLMCINLLFGDPFGLNVTGTAYIAAATLCAVGAILLVQGFTAIYIARIYTESLNRPLFTINERLSNL